MADDRIDATIIANTVHLEAGLRRAESRVEGLLAQVGLRDLRAERRARRAVGVVFAGIPLPLGETDPAFLDFQRRLPFLAVIELARSYGLAITSAFRGIAESASRASLHFAARTSG